MQDHATALLKGDALRQPAEGASVESAMPLTRDIEVASPVRSPRVLGLSFYFHDSAAALVCDGRVVAAAAEERFCRRKHTNEFPKQAIAYCLQAGQIDSINDIDAIVFYEKPILKLSRLLETLVEVWPRGLDIFTRGLPRFLTSKFNVFSAIQKTLPAYQGPILFAEHHLSHAASAFYCSPYDEAAILTIDGVGEWETTAIGVGRGNDIHLDRAIRFPHSVGLLYSALTSYLGFQVNDGEWKVMGLAPYGEPKYVEQFRRLVEIKPDGSFALNMTYFAHHYSSEWSADNQQWQALFGFPRREPKAEIEQHHEDLARSGQAVVEEIILNLAREARRASGSDNLVIAGGVGLNSVANWKIEQQGIFKNVWIQPAAGDDGGALGAALLASHVTFNAGQTPEMTDAYLGPEYSDQQILEVLSAGGTSFERLSDQVLVERVADLIAGGKVVGWSRGRMEFGPRALGSRSILADATNPGMKAIINEKIKYREYFRPFAPAVPIEDVHRYFDVPPGTVLPFMLKVPRVRAEVKDRIPAVTHEDGSGRVQTVTREDNPLYYDLLKAVGRRTGVPIVINTSFNVRGEPVVCSPQDAINCFLQTGIDALVLGNCLITEKADIGVDVGHGYARSDALEAQIGARQRSTAADASTPGAPAMRLSGVSINTSSADAKTEVRDIYEQLPFMFYGNAVDTAIELRKSNRIKAYPPVHALLRANAEVSVLDAGCGSGWFANSCAHHYGCNVIGFDDDDSAVLEAQSLARLMAANAEFVEADVHAFHPQRQFRLINALHGIRHAADAGATIRRLAGWVEPGGYLHLGLYHRPGRQPFLDHFRHLKDRGTSEAALYAEFKRLNPQIAEESYLQAWFHDQVLAPAEAQYTYAEVDELLQSAGCHIECTSLNGYKRLPSASGLAEVERRRAVAAREALRTDRFYPGYFAVWARRT